MYNIFVLGLVLICLGFFSWLDGFQQLMYTFSPILAMMGMAHLYWYYHKCTYTTVHRLFVCNLDIFLYVNVPIQLMYGYVFINKNLIYSPEKIRQINKTIGAISKKCNRSTSPASFKFDQHQVFDEICAVKPSPSFLF